MSSLEAAGKYGGFVAHEIKKGPKRKTHEDFCKEMLAINKNIEIIGRYVLSTKKVQCKCRICGNTWEAFPSNLLKGKGCPVCSGRSVAVGVNDLITLFPNIAKEWNKTKNAPLMPSDVKSGSSRKVWWICSTLGQKVGRDAQNAGILKKVVEDKRIQKIRRSVFMILSISTKR